MPAVPADMMDRPYRYRLHARSPMRTGCTGWERGVRQREMDWWPGKECGDEGVVFHTVSLRRDGGLWVVLLMWFKVVQRLCPASTLLCGTRVNAQLPKPTTNHRGKSGTETPTVSLGHFCPEICLLSIVFSSHLNRNDFGPCSKTQTHF